MSFDRVKEVYDKRWKTIMEAVIQNDAQSLYIVDPIQFPITQSAQVTEADNQVEGMADQEGQGEHNELETYFDYGEQRHWDDLQRHRVDRNAYPVAEVQRLAWEVWLKGSYNS